MADSSIKMVLDVTDAALFRGADPTRREVLRTIRDRLDGYISGNKRCNEVYAWLDGAKPAFANGTVTFATSSGTVGVVINGVTITVTWATSDTASMTALVAAIVASTNALVQYQVTAANFAGTITLASVTAGQKVSIAGYEFTAQSGGTLAADRFDISGTDAQAATSLANQINVRTELYRQVIASASSNVVTVRQVSGTAALSPGILTGASTITVSALAAAPVGLITALQPGITSNAMTIAASGTNVSVSGARLTGGAGNNVSPTIADEG